MKKKDSVSDVLIDVPGNVPPLGVFPYFGFWQSIYKQLPKALEVRTGFSKFDISPALKEAEDLVNGSYKVIVGEKLWKIGELLAMNQYIPAHGSGGAGLPSVLPSRDLGRIQIASATFEPIINAILQRNSMSGAVGQEMATVESEYNSKLQIMSKLVNRMSDLEEDYISYEALSVMKADVEAKQRNIAVLEAEINQLSMGIEYSKKAGQEINKLASALKAAEGQHDSVISQIERWQSVLNNADRNGDGLTHANATRKLTELGKANGELAQRIRGLGIQTQKLETTYTDPHEMNVALKELTAQRMFIMKELSPALNQLKKSENNFMQVEAEIQQVRKQGATLSADLEFLSGKMKEIRESQQLVVSENESDLVRMWVNHLSQVYVDIENYLFANLRIAQEAAISAQGSSIYMQKAISAEKIAKMEEFMSAIDTVSDYLDNDEVRVLEQVARLGTLLDYLPGTARIIALRNMSYSQRTEAYRNMVEEIIDFGQRDESMDKRDPLISIGPIEIAKSEPLSEVADLLQHLSDSLME
jgi:uncharacterized coiled-coil DUF342 family protein